MRFSTITVAAVLVLGALVQAAPSAVKRGGSSSGPDAKTAGNGDVVDQSYTQGPAQDAQTAGVRPQTPENSGLDTTTGGSGCGGSGQCPTGPSSPSDCIGIIQSLLRELYPTLDFTAHELDVIVADVFRILGADDISYAFLHGRIGLLNDLLALLGCTLAQLLLAIEQAVAGLA